MANKKSKQGQPKILAQNKIIKPMPKATVEKFSITSKLALLLVLISFLVYANTLKNGFVFDDSTVITENAIVKQGFKGIPELLVTSRLKGYGHINNENYRPLPLVIAAVEYELFGAQPAEEHFVNIFFFMGCVVALFLFFNKLFYNQRTGVAFIGALLFALHPIHTEVVANIKSRDELLCFFFAFLALNLFINYSRSGKLWQLLIGIVSLFLAFLSKETVISFLFVIPFIFFVYISENKKRSIFISIGTLLVVVSFLAIRASILKGYDSGAIPFIDNPLVNAPHLAMRLATAIMVLGMYVKLLIIPYPLICDYSYNSIPTVDFSNIAVMISLAIYLTLAIIGIYRLITKRKDPWAFCIVFFLATISLFSNIPFLVYSEMAERFLFFASSGFCLFIALGIEKWVVRSAIKYPLFFKNTNLMAILLPVSILYSYLTVTRNSDWKDNSTLFNTDLRKMPLNSKLNCHYATELVTPIAKQEKNPELRKKIIEKGISYLYKSLTVFPAYGYGQFVMGYAYSEIQRYDSSEFYYKKSLESNPNDILTLNNLGGIYFNTRQYPSTILILRKVLALDPGYVQAYANIGLSYLNLYKFDSAIIYSNKAITVDPTHNLSYETLAYTYNAMKIMDSAKKYEAVARINNPDFKL